MSAKMPLRNLLNVLMLMGVGLVILLLFPSNHADAASSNGYVYNHNGCKVQVYTDYYTYSKNAKTVDAWATNSGCGKLYYTMKVVDQWGHSASSQTHTGHFSSQTPIKSFDISKISRYNDSMGPSSAYMVEIYFYKDAAKTKYVGMANTNIVVNK